MNDATVIVPVKNEERNLERLLPALENQRFPPNEVLVAVAPSTTDRSREVVEKYHPFARWMNGGMPGPGRNAGARHAHGRYLFFLDADALPGIDTFFSDAIEEMEARKLGIATVDHVGIGTTLKEKMFYGIYNAAQRFSSHRKRSFACGTCIIATREVHDSIGGFDERWAFYEDSDYVQRAKQAGFGFGVLSRRMYILADPRRLRKDGVLTVLKNGVRADKYARQHGIITDLRLIDGDYFAHTTHQKLPRFPTRFLSSVRKDYV